jgi:hypothetical protein
MIQNNDANLWILPNWVLKLNSCVTERNILHFQQQIPFLWRKYITLSVILRNRYNIMQFLWIIVETWKSTWLLGTLNSIVSLRVGHSSTGRALLKETTATSTTSPNSMLKVNCWLIQKMFCCRHFMLILVLLNNLLTEMIKRQFLYLKQKFRRPTGLIARSQWPRGLSHKRPPIARTLDSWVQILFKTWISLVCVYSLFVLFCVRV